MCVKCGCNLVLPPARGGAPVRPSSRLDPSVAVLLSLVLVGLPQIVMGQATKGVVMLVSAMIFGALTGCIACLVTWPVAAIDAYMIASKIQRGQRVGEWEFF